MKKLGEKPCKRNFRKGFRGGFQKRGFNNMRNGYNKKYNSKSFLGATSLNKNKGDQSARK